MLDDMKAAVFEANIALKRNGLVVLTWGNASCIDREKGLFVIKPSGIPYDELTPGDMVVMDMDGKKAEGRFRPSSDARTHLELYKDFSSIGGVVHTHSSWATVFAQSCRGIPMFGTTHADYFHGEIPCTRDMTVSEINGLYETETGKLIIEAFKDIDYNEIPGVLVRNHGPFTWGKDCLAAAENAVALEQIAMMAFNTLLLDGGAKPVSRCLADRHFFRKHGDKSYYGQD